MTTVQVELDERTLERLRTMAEARRLTVEQLIRQFLETSAAAAPPGNSMWGMLADEPDLVDKAVDDALESRERHPLRDPARG